MPSKLIPLDDFRLSDYPNARLTLDRSPLSIVDPESLTEQNDTSDLTVPVGLATVLYNWCSDGLAAFLDFDAWFSFTWHLTLQQGEPDESRIEIGRVGNQITIGTLDKNGDNWTLMLTFNIIVEGDERGKWVANPKESMEGEKDVTDAREIESLAREFVRDLVAKKRWETGRRIRHNFYIEYAPMDVWGDGIPMNPHWLYKSLNLSECSTCGAAGKSLSRCGKCGTATYCSSTCQRVDWAVHKGVCTMGMEDRGQALKITEKGGLIIWDPSKTMVEEGSREESKNPNFAEPQLKRTRL